MKTQKLKRMMSLFLAALICVTTLVGFGTTAYAAEETDEVCLVSFPRDGDANYGGEWGHGSFNFMNGWFAQTSRYTTVRAMGSYDGNICYCIEPGVPQESGDRYTKKGENFWDNYPSSYNHTISPDDIKLFIGRIFQYGYTGTISTSWRSQNEGGDKLAHAVATQLLVWETIVGERDADFNKVGTGGKDAICDQVSTGHPLYTSRLGVLSNYIDYESFGRDIRFDESGVFADHGYVRSNGGRFVDIYDGKVENIPEEYRIKSPKLYERAVVGRTEKDMER